MLVIVMFYLFLRLCISFFFFLYPSAAFCFSYLFYFCHDVVSSFSRHFHHGLGMRGSTHLPVSLDVDTVTRGPVGNLSDILYHHSIEFKIEHWKENIWVHVVVLNIAFVFLLQLILCMKNLKNRGTSVLLA